MNELNAGQAIGGFTEESYRQQREFLAAREKQAEQIRQQQCLGSEDKVAAQRLPEIVGSLNRLDSVVDILEKLSHALGDRLSPVLRPGPEPSNGETNERIRPASVPPICNRIDSAHDKLEKTLHRIGSIIQRLEI